MRLLKGGLRLFWEAKQRVLVVEFSLRHCGHAGRGRVGGFAVILSVIKTATDSCPSNQAVKLLGRRMLGRGMLGRGMLGRLGVGRRVFG
jgi:hypothetical protein